jgi:serine/threonine protein kinase
MSLAPGVRLGAYEVSALIGAGGMGEVYRAKDTKLGREVALKLLPDTFTHDSERLARLRREAQVLASLNHPHIGAIYGLDEVNGQQFLVLELVDGETLHQRIARGPIPVEEALPIARQIAEALEAAHEKGIVHRDLKPSNIAFTADGQVKVLDFGLAKLVDPAGAGLQTDPSALSQSPTMTSPALMTGAGVLLGTAAYMSPEQAKGRVADKQSDVWAFGCVLYEMLAGRAVFEGETVGEILAELLKSEPDWGRLPADTPEAIRRLLRRCLRKEPIRRVRDMRDVCLDIDEAQGESPADRSLSQSTRRTRKRPIWSSAAGIAALVGVAALAWTRLLGSSAPQASEVRLQINAPPTRDPRSLAISPDGRTVAFVADVEGTPRLWLRPLNSTSAQALAQTDGAEEPFWSPDSRSVAVFAGGRLKRIDAGTGAVQTLANVHVPVNSRGGSWSHDDVILFSSGPSSTILRVPVVGGEPVPVTHLSPAQTGHVHPAFFPDGRHFLYYATGSPEARGIYIGQLDRSDTRRLLDADAAVPGPLGSLVFVRQGKLFAQELDLVSLTLIGGAATIADQVDFEDDGGSAAVSASASGPLVYRSLVADPRRFALVWFDRAGNEIGKAGGAGTTFQSGLSLSPDGRRVAIGRVEVSGNSDIWMVDAASGVSSRLTFNPSDDGTPVWSQDGKQVAFYSRRTESRNLYVRPATGAGTENLILASAPAEEVRLLDWSPDGHFLLFQRLDPITGSNIWALRVDGDRKPFPLIETNFNEQEGQFSPDGKWIAYRSDESGRSEIYVQPFSDAQHRATGKWQVSIKGGAQVRWRADGKELFFIGLDDQLMAVTLRVASDGTSIEADAPTPLFRTRVGGALTVNGLPHYALSRDGRRFLMNTVTDNTVTSPITVLLNWRSNLAP